MTQMFPKDVLFIVQTNHGRVPDTREREKPHHVILSAPPGKHCNWPCSPVLGEPQGAENPRGAGTLATTPRKQCAAANVLGQLVC